MTPRDLVESYEAAADPPILAGVGDVDWSAVTHAHGPATDVPALLRAAVSDDLDHRDFAWQLLFETVWHCGTVYPATAKVVPFLYRLLENDDVPDQWQAALLLASIADGDSYLAVHATDPQSVAIFEQIAAERGSTLAEDMARELTDVDAARQAVRTQLDLLYPYLRDPEPNIRASVAIAIGHYPDIVTRLLADLTAALRDEPDEEVQDVLRRIIAHAEPGAAPDRQVG